MNPIYFLALLLLPIQNAFTETILNTDSFTVTGYVSIADFEKFSTAIKKKIRVVRFENCFGGNGLAGFRFAEEIKKAGLTTVASGIVASACAYAFLGGNIRKLDQNSAQNVIMFHGQFYPKSLKPKGRVANQELLDIYEKHIQFQFSKVVREIILNTINVDEGIYFVSIKTASDLKSVGYYCNGKLPFAFANCENLADITMQSQGILTQSP